MSNGLSIPDLAGKAVLITGASSGIGAALAEAFAAQGAIVGVHYNASAAGAETVVAAIRAAGGQAEAFRADVTDSTALAAAVEAAATRFGRLDGLVNNAGGMVGRMPYAAFDDAVFEKVIALNVRSVVAATHAALPHLKRRGGFVINTTSIAARTGSSIGAGFYGSAKTYVENVTRGMAKEFIPFGIRVNAVAPGIIRTPFHDGVSDEAYFEAMGKAIPMGRIGVAEDLVGPYLFLASEALSGYMIGQVLEVNGGQLMP